MENKFEMMPEPVKNEEATAAEKIVEEGQDSKPEGEVVSNAEEHEEEIGMLILSAFLRALRDLRGVPFCILYSAFFVVCRYRCRSIRNQKSAFRIQKSFVLYSALDFVPRFCYCKLLSQPFS